MLRSAIILAVAGFAMAAAAAEPDPTLAATDIVWVHRPSGMDMASAWPSGAPSANARIVLQCTIRAGAVTACVVVSEDPAGTAARAAALKVVTHFKAAATTKSGAPTEGGTVRIPISWAFGS